MAPVILVSECKLRKKYKPNVQYKENNNKSLDGVGFPFIPNTFYIHYKIRPIKIPLHLFHWL